MTSSPLNEKQKFRIEEFKKKEMEDLTQILSQKYGLPYINLSQIPVQLDALKIIPEEKARKGYLAAFHKIGKTLKIIVKNPNLDAAKIILDGLKSDGYKPELFLGSENSLEKTWSYYKDVPIYIEARSGIIEISTEKISAFASSLTSI